MTRLVKKHRGECIPLLNALLESVVPLLEPTVRAIKALIQAEGTATRLDPKFNVDRTLRRLL